MLGGVQRLRERSTTKVSLSARCPPAHPEENHETSQALRYASLGIPLQHFHVQSRKDETKLAHWHWSPRPHSRVVSWLVYSWRLQLRALGCRTGLAYGSADQKSFLTAFLALQPLQGTPTKPH
jgi:hypothetical protein